MGKTIRAVLAILLIPSLALASMDMPAGASALFPMFYSGLIFIGLEMYVLSRTVVTNKLVLFKITGSVYICTFIFMIAFNRAGIVLHHFVDELLGWSFGVYVGLGNPSPWDKIYTATVGCFYLPGTDHVVVAGFAILSFLITVFLVSGAIERKMLCKQKAADVNVVRRVVTNLKVVELVVIWAGSFFYFFKWYNG